MVLLIGVLGRTITNYIYPLTTVSTYTTTAIMQIFGCSLRKMESISNRSASSRKSLRWERRKENLYLINRETCGLRLDWKDRVHIYATRQKIHLINGQKNFPN